MIICFDFDGVLCSYDKWQGHNHFGKPNKEMIELVKKLDKKNHQLILSTTRLNPLPFWDRPLDKDVQNGFANKMIKNWLREQRIYDCFCLVTGFKPFAHIYIDDKGLYFEGDIENLETEIEEREMEFKNKIEKGID